MSNHHHPPEDRDWHEYQERLETHDYAIINNCHRAILDTVQENDDG